MSPGIVEEVRRLSSHGFAPIPLYRPVTDAAGQVVACNCWKGADCPPKHWGKHPVNPGWQKAVHLFQDPDEVVQEFSSRHRLDLNVGCATGPSSGLLIIDIDVGDDKPGLAEIEKLQEENGPLPTTPRVITGSGGYHDYFLYPANADIRNSSGKVAPGVDIRGTGGQGVLPPSLHLSGNAYRWAPGRAPWEVPVAPLPAAWVVLLTHREEKKHARRKPTSRPAPTRSLYPPMTMGQSMALLAAMLQHPLVQWADAHPEEVSREVWRGIATNLAIPVLDCNELDDIARLAFHALSSDYPDYSDTETENEFTSALHSAASCGPITFAHMQQHGAPSQQCRSHGGSSLVHAARRTLLNGSTPCLN